MHDEQLVALDAVLEGTGVPEDLLPSLLWVLRRPLYAVIAPRTWTQLVDVFRDIFATAATTRTETAAGFYSLGETETRMGPGHMRAMGTASKCGDFLFFGERTVVLGLIDDARQPHPKFVEPSYVVGPADGGPDV